MAATLKLTDGTTTVDLLGSYGYALESWRPAIAEYKAGGTYSDSPLAHGRRLVMKRWQHVVETFRLKLRGSTTDLTIQYAQDLRRLLEKASDYWTSGWQSEPVWLEAKASKETEPRYAHVMQGRVPEDENPFATPFLQPSCAAVMDKLTLVLERLPWSAQKPAVTEWAMVNTLQEDWGIVSALTAFYSTESADDASWRSNWEACLSLTSTSFALQVDDEPSEWLFMRFRNVTIPQGSSINAAYLDLTSAATKTSTGLATQIYCEDSSTPGSGCRQDQPRTTAYTTWANIPSMYDGETYSTASFAEAVKEVVGRSDWASGKNISVHMVPVEDRYNPGMRIWATYDHPTEAKPALWAQWTIPYTVDVTGSQGDVYVANKQNMAMISHLYLRDQFGTWEGNFQVGTTPHVFLPYSAPSEAYYGCDTTIDNSGPFSSIVFDIIGSASLVGTEVFDWQYYNGATWASLSVQDNTGDFTTSGVTSVHWKLPADWVPSNLRTLFEGTAPNIEGYWVRYAMTSGGAPVAWHRDVNSHPYTITWPQVKLTDVSGDIPALGRIQLYVKSDKDFDTTEPKLWANRFIMGTRDSARGVNFVSYINIADEQNPSHILVNDSTSPYSPFTAGWVTDVEAPSGRRLANIAPTTSWVNYAHIDIISSHGNQYRGRYHAYLRVYQTAGTAGQVQVRLKAGTAYAEVPHTGPTATIATKTQWELVDLGTVSLPPADIVGPEELGNLGLLVQLKGPSGSDTTRIYDLILMPVDEWALDIRDPDNGVYAASGNCSDVLNGQFIDVDSITRPRRGIRAISRRYDQGALKAIFELQATGDVEFVEDQCLYVIMAQQSADAAYANPAIAGSIRIGKKEQYLSGRGAR